jgi:signal transduction histidine kinase
MLHSNGHVPAIVTLFSNDCPSWLRDVSRYLGTHNYHSTIAQSTNDAWQLIRLQQPDIVLAAGDQYESKAIFQSIREELLPHEQPLLVLIGDTFPTQIDPSWVDFLAAPAPIDYLDHQLRTFLTLRSRNTKLTQENRQLIEQLKNEQESAGGINFLRNAIVRNVAHELRTPLLQVKAAVGLLAEDMGDSTTLIELAQRATTRLEAGVQNITLLNELVNESFENRTLEPVQIKEVVDSAVRNLRRSWEHKDHVERITLQIPPKLQPVWGDKHRLVIALQLLIDNALKFSEDRVEVSAKRTGQMVTIAVRDYGIGIPEDKIHLIYDWFYQVDSSTTRPYGGMGIGLAIVRYILERHNAEIEVETKVGAGSTFSFKLPIANLKTSK